jgi:PhoPQ-activated pathogenicity-related protein
MTSQKWLSEKYVDRSIWWHYVVSIVPDELEFNDKSIVFIGGGSNTDDIPNIENDLVILGSKLALNTKSIVTVLFQIPNQPLLFYDDELQSHRKEDAAVAFTWYHFLKNPFESNEWPLRLPMTKAVVKCMDLVQDYYKKNFAYDIQNFIVSGASKRGWTTYFTAAVDKRVMAMIPIVMDMLNIIPSVHHMYKSYGGWTFAFKDYYDLDILEKIDSSEMELLQQIEDPISYINRYKMPKLIVNAGNDEFFMVDNSQFWWDKMPNPKYRLVIQNADHSLATGILEAVPSISEWIYHIFTNQELPNIKWSLDDSTINVETNTEPQKVLLWYAKTCDDQKKDFRILNLNSPCNCGFEYENYCTNLKTLYKKEDISNKNISINKWSYSIDNVEKGWINFFIELEYKNKLSLTTESLVVPKTFPFEDCHNETCKGKLV